ncbi:hypothetical protein [Aestuariivivens marinum]|uniref:hypothetical protein n=1 Tax=Aestuariivivens marinum TaxID=2913555 RepID=UPI001F57B194|nr:hypothetical protein [Aestuariivivens marinum]
MKWKVNILIILIYFIQGCSSPKYLSAPKDFQNNVKGLYFKCKIKKKQTKFIGEIIEVGDDHIKLLSVKKGEKMIILDRNAIEEAEIMVALSVDDPKKIDTWASLVNVMSIGHGFWGGFTLPMNIAIVSTGINKKNIYRMKYPEHITWGQLRKYARFPQGIPKTIDENLIK